MSAGYVSGAAALFLEAHPAATPNDVADWIRESGTRTWWRIRGAGRPACCLWSGGASE